MLNKAIKQSAQRAIVLHRASSSQQPPQHGAGIEPVSGGFRVKQELGLYQNSPNKVEYSGLESRML